jgi:HlyD family secretion protein
MRVKRNENRLLNPLVLLGVILALAGLTPTPSLAVEAAPTDAAQKRQVISVVEAKRRPAPQTIVATGSLVARTEVLVSPQIEGLRVIELLAEEGDQVQKGQALARLDRALLDTQHAQLQAGLKRAQALIAQAESKIIEAEANAKQANAAFARAKKLIKSGTTSKAVYDQHEAASRSATAGLAAAKDGLALAKADKEQLEAQLSEMKLKLGYTEIKAPSAGIISRRTAKLGGTASASAEPLFRIVANGEIELDGAVADIFLPQIASGMKVHISGSGIPAREGAVRLISPEVNQKTREGRVRISIRKHKDLRIGAFAMGIIQTEGRDVLVVPYSAVMHGDEGATVHVVKNGRVETRDVNIGAFSKTNAEITSGLSKGETVVLRAGALLHDGDMVTPVSVSATRAKGE